LEDFLSLVVSMVVRSGQNNVKVTACGRKPTEKPLILFLCRFDRRSFVSAIRHPGMDYSSGHAKGAWHAQWPVAPGRAYD
jgi:hypothetical protein